MSALARICYYLTFHQKRTLIKAFFESQFRFSKLDVSQPKKKKKLICCMKELLGWSIMIKYYHFRNFLTKIIQLLFKILKWLQPLLTIYLPHIIVAIFAKNLSLLFQVCVLFITVKILCSIYSPLICNMIFGYIKDLEVLDIFKGKLRKWEPLNWPCRFLRKYIPNLGFINQIWFNISAYNLVVYNVNAKGYFTLLVDATKM